jgi:hypothetical protein
MNDAAGRGDAPIGAAGAGAGAGAGDDSKLVRDSAAAPWEVGLRCQKHPPHTHTHPSACVAPTPPSRGRFLCAVLQVDAVEAALSSDFCDEVGSFWDTVKDRLRLRVVAWKRKTEGQQCLLLAANGLKDDAQQRLLTEAINVLLGISEWRALEGGGVVRPLTWVFGLAGGGGGHLCVPGLMPLTYRT